MRRLLSLFLIITIMLVPAVGRADDAPPVVPARAYLLMDAASGQVLYSVDGETQLPMASTTKIMTAILALERGKLTDIVTAGQKPYDTGGSTIYLDLGEQQTLQNLLYALMLESANDAAVAIAEHLGGTEEHFVEWMNAKAREIGATQTHFANSHGLHDPNHYTTAHDLALIARYALQNPEFRRLVTTEEATIPGFQNNPPRHLVSHNQLLGYYDGVTGVKNGFTEEALLTNVASAKRGDTELIAVVLGAQNYIWTSSMALLDFGFSHFQSRRIVQKGDEAGRLPVPGGAASDMTVQAAADLSVAVPLGGPEPERRLVPLDGLQAPVAAGAPVGRLVVSVGGKEAASVEVTASRAVAAAVAVSPVTSAGVRLWPWLLTAILPLALLMMLSRRKRRSL